MHVSINFRLSATGQKASILAGGDGKADQVRLIPQDSPLFASALSQATMKPDGSAVCEWNDWRAPCWDTIPTDEELIGWQAAKAAREAAEKAVEEAEHRKEGIAALSEKRVRWTVLDAVEPPIRYATADWPYKTPQDVKDSAEAQAWLAELTALQATAEAQAAEHKAAREVAAKAEREAAEAERLAERERLGLVEGELALEIEEGALAEVPSKCWESHSRGKNWLAVIAKDPSAPGGLRRAFQEKAKGNYYYHVAGLSVADAVEFGADYYSGRGRKSPTRWYGVVTRITDSHLIVKHYATSAQAIVGAKNMTPATSEVDTAIARVNSEGAIV